MGRALLIGLRMENNTISVVSPRNLFVQFISLGIQYHLYVVYDVIFPIDNRQHKAMDIKPESIISSGYDPIKNEEETDDEDMCNDINTSNSHENHLLLPINIKEEVVKFEVKTEDDISTDDERSPEYVVSSSGYDPVKSEETDDEELDEDTNTSNEQHLPIKVKAEVKTEDDVSTDDEYSSETKELIKPSAQPNAPIQDSSMDIQRTTKKRRSKRKREAEESDVSVEKAARIECSVEGCTGKAADSGTCKWKHGGWNYCSHEGCTNQVRNRGVCIRHGASWTKKTCTHEGCISISQKGGFCVKHGEKRKTCSHEGCNNQVVNEGVCIKHGAKKVRKTCSYVGCTKQAQKGGVCTKHGAKRVRKTCSHEGCIKHIVKGGLCTRHYKLSNKLSS